MRLGCLLFGALLPDIIDKSLKFVGVYPWGRTVGHSVFVWAAFHLVLTYLLFEASRSRETKTRPLWLPHLTFVSIGWISHFLADIADDFVQGLSCTGQVASAWMGWPLTNPDMHAVMVGPRGPDCFTGLEMAVVLMALLAAPSLLRSRR